MEILCIDRDEYSNRPCPQNCQYAPLNVTFTIDGNIKRQNGHKNIQKLPSVKSEAFLG